MNEPKWRFKADDGSQFPDWEEKSFGDFFITHSEKTSDRDSYPLYSLTIESGVQPKTERYEREFLVKKEGDNYKIVPPNAFVYNPMNLRFGALKVNHEKFSVSVSGYYNVFSLKDDSALAFWENYLVTHGMLNYYFSIATGSLIEKLRVHYSQFMRIKKAVPSLPEQQKIAEFLVAIGTVIEKQKETVSAWEERKKGVMQKLFSQEVRFKADDGSEFPEWEEKSFSDVFENLNNSTFSRDCLNYETGNVKYIHYGDILIKFGFVIDVQSSNVPYVNEDLNCEKYASLSEGDIVIADTAEDDTVGKAVEVMNTHWGKTISGLHTIACHPMGKFASKYLGYFMNSDIYHNQLRPYMQGIKVTSVSKTNIALTKILVPCLVEQQKIADCLSALDEVIEKQKATLAAWEELKKGLLQQMFV